MNYIEIVCKIQIVFFIIISFDPSIKIKFRNYVITLSGIYKDIFSIHIINS